MVAITYTPQIENVDWFLEHCQVHQYAKKSTIIAHDSPCDSLYFILAGTVTIYIEDSNEKAMVITYLNQGNFFGEIGLFIGDDKQRERVALAQARTACEIAKISYVKFRELTQIDPKMLYVLGSQMANALRNTTIKVGNLAFHDVTGRVARTLLQLCKQPDAITHADGMQIKVTRQEIGRIVGCSREMVGRVLKTLENQELIQVKGQTIVVFGTR